MNWRKYACLALALAGCAGSVWADPHHRHARPRASVEFGFYLGAPWAYPPYYGYPYYWPRVYAPPVVAPVIVAPPQPPVYVEQPTAPASVPTLEPGYWYWCNEA